MITWTTNVYLPPNSFGGLFFFQKFHTIQRMRKLLWFLLVLILGLCVAAAVVWMNRTDIAAHFLSKGLHVPVTIQSLEIGNNQSTIEKLWVGNPSQSKTNTSFSAETIQINATMKELRGNPLVIEEIDLKNVFIGVEKYGTTTDDNNWAHILQSDKAPKKQGRDYLIKTLILENLTVAVTDADGKTKQYPTIPRMEFHNISSETGFPVSEIEKAIFKMVMKELIQKYSIDFLKSLNPTQLMQSPGNPLNWF